MPISLQLAGEAAAAAAEPSPPAASQPARPSPRRQQKPGRPKRRFPYRKVAELEDEIFAIETCIQQLQQDLARGETHRDGQRVRQIKADIARHQESLSLLYQHWEEATELNW